MGLIFVDTVVLIDAVDGQPGPQAAARKRLTDTVCHASELVVAELLSFRFASACLCILTRSSSKVWCFTRSIALCCFAPPNFAPPSPD